MSRQEPGTEPIAGAQPPTELAPAIPLEEVGRIAERVQELIAAGNEAAAWQRLRQLHPADVGLILAGLPRASSEALLQIMSPQTVTWMLQHMNPVEASRLGARLGLQTLSFVLDQVHPRHALSALQRLPIRQAQEVAEQLDQPIADSELLSQDPNTAGALMSDRFVAVNADAGIPELRANLAELQEDRTRLTFLYLLDAQGLPVAQISMVDLALADADGTASSIASPLTAMVSVDTSAQECARLRRHYNLTQLPVVEGNTLIGASSNRASASGGHGASRPAWRSMRTTTDSTFGRGRNTEAGTLPTTRAVPLRSTSTLGMPRARDPGGAASRSPTSRCTITTMVSMAPASRSRSRTSGVAML